MGFRSRDLFSYARARQRNQSTFLLAGDVTKIEVVLEEAPNAVVVGSMSSELEATAELNSTFPDGESNNSA